MQALRKMLFVVKQCAEHKIEKKVFIIWYFLHSGKFFGRLREVLVGYKIIRVNNNNEIKKRNIYSDDGE